MSLEKTQAQAIDWLLRNVGKSLNYDNRYGAQCWDFVMFYVKFLGKTAPAVHGAAQWAQTAWPEGFDKVPLPAQPGDIAIWGATQSNPYGHAMVVVSTSGASLDVVDQNYVNYDPNNGSPAARHSVPINSRLIALWRPRFAPDANSGGATNKYTIKNGDTFYALEKANGWPTNTLVSLNPGIDPRKLKIGQDIIVPAGHVEAPTHPNPPQPTPAKRVHTVTNGENLSVIAAHYGVKSWHLIYEVPENRQVIGGNPSMLQPGMRLIIP